MNIEHEYIEFKLIWKDEYLKHICGFANSNGGVINIGINDNGEIVGVNNAKKLLEDIPNKIINNLGIYPRIKIYTKNSLQYISINIDKNEEPISYKSKFYIRSGSTTQELKGIKLQEFLLKKQNLSWDDIGIPCAKFEDIDINTVNSFIEKAILANRISSEAKSYNIQTLFENLNLVDKSGYIKRAALLAFAKNPIKFFTTASFKIGRFITDIDIITQDIIEENVFNVAEKIIPLLKSKYLKSNISYNGVTRIERLEYPEKALREAIFNAIVHKDYSGSFIQMKVNNNSLSIWNDGLLPENLNFDNLKKEHASIPRNKTLASLFFKAGYIESWGRGISVIYNECEQNGIPEPIITENSGGFFIEFYNKEQENVGTNVGTNVGINVGINISQVLLTIKNNPNILILEMAKKFTVSERTIERYLKKLKEKGIITRIGSNKLGYWKINE